MYDIDYGQGRRRGRTNRRETDCDRVKLLNSEFLRALHPPPCSGNVEISAIFLGECRRPLVRVFIWSCSSLNNYVSTKSRVVHEKLIIRQQ